MIGKLFAQEFRSTRKSLLVSVGLMLLIAAVSLVPVLLDIPILNGIGLGIGVIAIIIITPAVLGLLVENYWRTMYGREGYFTMTLPVRGRELFTAKVLYGLVASLVAGAVTVAAAAGALVVFAVSQGTSVSLAFEGIWNTIGVVGQPMVWFLIGSIVLQLAFTVITGAAIMSIGAEARYNHMGFGAPIIGAVLLYVVMQVLGFAAMMFIPFGVKVIGPDAGSFVAEGMIGEFTKWMTVGLASDPSVIGLGIVPLSIAVAALFAWWGGRSVERHTSLR